MILFLFLVIDLKSETAAAQTAISTGRLFFISFSISFAEVIFLTSKLFEKTKLEGPDINLVFIPSFFKAKATSYPCFPLDSFEIYLTGSRYSLVGPVVTTAEKFLFFTKFFSLK